MVANDQLIHACKIRLKPTTEQYELMWHYSRVARNYWNMLVAVDMNNSEGKYDDKFQGSDKETYYSRRHNRDVYKLKEKDYRYLVSLEIEELYKEDSEKYGWYYRNNQAFIYNTTIREFIDIRVRNKGRVKFRAYDETTPRFSVRCDWSSNKKHPSRIYLDDNRKLQIPSIGRVNFGNVPKGIDLSGKKQTAQIIHDGKYWYLIFTEYYEPTVLEVPYSDGVGIDLGLKVLASISNGTVVPSVRSIQRYRRLKKRLAILQRRLSRKYRLNNCNKHNKTNNIKKLERQIKRLYRKISNFRKTYILDFVAKLIKEKPQYIALEHLNVKGMMKNKHLAGAVAETMFYYVRNTITWKAKQQGIAIRLVNRWYPSSKTCHDCGWKNSKLTLKDRIFRCTECGYVCDRDMNAAYNLRDTSDYQLA